MSVTARGIYHNLNESEYAISNTDVAFFFSSKLYRCKFLEEHKEYRIEFRERLARAMDVEGMNTDFLSDIYFYRQVEKRGFRVVKEDEGGNFWWDGLHRYALARTIRKNTLEWLEMHVQK